MKKIICYGDSNTFGHNAVDYTRYDENTRWCGIIRKALERKAEITEMGLNGRTIMTDDLLRTDRNSYKTITDDIKGIDADIITIMLGTNDCKFDFGLSAEDIAEHMELLINKVKNICPDAQILLISPVPMTEDCVESPLEFDLNSAVVSSQLSGKYEKIAKNKEIMFADADKWNVELCHDGCHYTKKGHQAFADNIMNIFNEMIQEA